jgi:hypothetical protein
MTLAVQSEVQKAKYNQQPFSNFGYDVAGDYLSSAGQSFKKAFTGQGVATMLPEMRFYPGGPTGAEKVYGGVADAGLGLFSTIVAGLGGVAGFVAEQVPFQSESSEDRLSRDLLGGIEFGEQFLAPYLGVPLRLSKIARLGQQGKNLPSMDLRLQDGSEFEDALSAFAAEERQRNTTQQPLLLEDFRDAVDPQFVPIEELEDLRIDPTRPIDIVNTTPPAGALVDDDITDIVDYEMVPDDDIDIDVDLDDDDMQERIQDVIQGLQDRGIEVTAAEAADEAARVAENVRLQEARALLPVTSINQAVNTEQLRELYAKYNLPIPTTEAEQRAANVIIESNNQKNAEKSLIMNFVPPENFRQGADLDYLKAHAPADVYNKHGPTVLEAKLIEQQENRLGALPPINDGNDGPRIAPEFYSSAVQAAKKLNVKSASYQELKRLMLKQKGVKIKELEWSGADEAFEGRKDVTPQELVEYLEDNTNLIEAKTIQGLPDYSGDIRVLEQRFVDRELPELLEQEEELFLMTWLEDLGLSGMESIQDYVASGNSTALDRFAETSSVGVETGEELAKKYPDGYILEKNDGVTLVFRNEDDASKYSWLQQKESYRENIRETLESEVEYAGYDLDKKDEYLAMLFPDGDIPAWAKEIYRTNTAVDDPSGALMAGDLEYAQYFPQGGTNMRETTYQFRDPTGKLEDDYFREAHFSESNREDNLVAHARTAEFPVQGGGTAYHVGEAQSDLQQGIRKEGKTPRTRKQEIDLYKIDQLERDINTETRGSEIALNRSIFPDVTIGLGTTNRRDQYPEDLETYKTIVANFKNKYLGTQFSSSDIDFEHTFFKESAGSIVDLQTKLFNFANYIIDNKNTVPTEYFNWAKNHIDQVEVKINKLEEKLSKFDRDLKNIDSNFITGAPFVESTDAWVDMVLRRQLADAIESGADYITLPNPRMVKDYTQGEFEGHRQFYGNIAPKNLLNIAKSADPTAELFPVWIQTDAGLENTIALPLTPSLIQSLRQKGLPNYMLPLTVGGAASYGTLGSITNDETRGGAI